MKFLVLGSGLMGKALALDLTRSEDVSHVTLADADGDRLEAVSRELHSHKLQTRTLDVQKYADVVDCMRGHDCAIGAISYRYNVSLSGAAIESGTHFCDLGGNDEVVAEQRTLDGSAQKRGILVLPNCGLAPGMANILAARGAERFDSLNSIRIRVGGLPQHPVPPLNYQLVFSVEGLVNEYTGSSVILRHGARTKVDAMTEVEEIAFPEPFGTLEAFHTSGGTSLLPSMFEGKVRALDYKTIRYPGHCEKFRTLLELGFASNEPISVGPNVLTEREIFFELLRRKLPGGQPDVVLVRVTIDGMLSDKSRHLQYDLIDYYDDSDNITAMMRTTAYPTSVIAQLVVAGTITQRGVLTPEQCVPLAPFLAGLAHRKVFVVETVS